MLTLSLSLYVSISIYISFYMIRTSRQTRQLLLLVSFPSLLPPPPSSPQLTHHSFRCLTHPYPSPPPPVPYSSPPPSREGGLHQFSKLRLLYAVVSFFRSLWRLFFTSYSLDGRELRNESVFQLVFRIADCSRVRCCHVGISDLFLSFTVSYLP